MYLEEANRKEQKEQRQSLRNHSTPAEAALWRLLKGSQVGGFKFRRQHGIGPYIMDFYCPTLRLCIELDGSVHHYYGAYEHDEERTRFLNRNGITVMRFENKVVWQNMNGIAEEILRFARERLATPAPPPGKVPPPPAGESHHPCPSSQEEGSKLHCK
ncbi:MAG: DUF559 domain-containing protein [Prevotella sp.]|nr:DUF559 domain-containing protein [Prevotella sp.]